MKKRYKLISLALCAFIFAGLFAACAGESPVKYTVTFNSPQGGSVTVSDANPVKGQNVAVTAKTDAGYYLTSFEVNGAAAAYTDWGDGTYTYAILNISANATVNVTFALIDLAEIYAEFKQGGNAVFSSDTMAEVKERLASAIKVSGVNNDGTDAGEISYYTLSCENYGAGEKTITVSVGGVETAIKVTVTEDYGSAVPFYADDKRIEIGMYHAPYWRYTGQDDINLIADMGVSIMLSEVGQNDYNNSGGQYFNTQAFRKSILDHAYNAGLKVIVIDSALQHNLQTANASNWNTKNVLQYIDHPAFYGVEIRDEPGGDYRNSSENAALAALKTKFYDTFPSDKLFFVNLLPTNQAQENILSSGCSAYRTYVSNYMSAVNPPMLSFDHYSLLVDNTIRSAYYHDLEYISRAAHGAKGGAGIPANAIMLSAGHFGGGDNDYKLITLEDLRWQIASSMAFGFDMLTHYDYVLDGYNQTCINPNTGVPTALYYDIQTANREVLMWDHVYLRFKWKGTAKVYSGSQPALLSKINQTKNINSIAGIDAMTAASVAGSSRSAIIGQFIDGAGGNAYMLTNATRPGANTSVSVTCTFAGGYGTVLVYEKGIPRVIKLGADGKADIALEAGEGKFIIPLA